MRLAEIDPVGKHLFYRLEKGTKRPSKTGKWLHVHLGLYGKFRPFELPAPEPKGAVRLRVIGENHGFDLNGPNCCEMLTDPERQAILDRLGPDPLRKDDPGPARERIGKSRAPVGTLLLDQSVIAGVGNIYRTEALFTTGIHPRRLGRDLTADEFDALWTTLVGMLRVGVKYNRIITVDWESLGKSATRLTREERLNVYERDRCPRCGGEIERFELANRKIFACGSCQA